MRHYFTKIGYSRKTTPFHRGVFDTPITSHTARELFRRALTRRILPVRIESETLMDLIAVDIDGTLASNRDQMDKYLTGFFASYCRFFKAIRHATVNVEVADRIRDMAV